MQFSAMNYSSYHVEAIHFRKEYITFDQHICYHRSAVDNHKHDNLVTEIVTRI